MGQENNIDNLFSSKLAGRESAAPYSASAWAGADKALGGHFKLLLLKKAAFVLIPLLVVSGVGAWYFTGTSETNASIITQEKNLESKMASDVAAASNDNEKEESISSTNEASIAFENTSSNTNPVGELSANEGDAESEPFEKGQALNNSFVSAAKHSKSNSANLSAYDQSSTTTGSWSKETETLQDNEQMVGTSKANSKMNGGFDALLDDLEEEATSVGLMSGSESRSVLAEHAIATDDFMYSMPIFNLRTIGKKRALLAENEKSIDFSELPNSKKMEFGANAGFVGANSLENNLGSRNRIGLGAYLGLNMQYHIKPRLFLYTAAILNTRYGLGSKSQSADPSISVYPSQLIYLDIPMHVGYRFGARHGLSFGMTFSPLITAINEDRHLEDYGANPTTSISKEGFANFDVAGSINYNLTLTKRIDFNAAFRFGLFDVTDDSYFRTDLIDDRNHQLRLGINYRFRAR